jgi:hypothetical protein
MYYCKKEAGIIRPIRLRDTTQDATFPVAEAKFSAYRA